MSDGALTIAVITTFAVLVTVHVATIFGLVKRRELLHAAGGLVFPPFAPYCAFVRGMRVRAVLWGVAASLYCVALLLAR